MGVGVVDELIHRLVHAVHLRFRVPQKSGRRPSGIQRVHGFVFRHLHPVDPAHVFAPSEDLPDESLHRVEWRLFVLISADRRVDGVAGIQQMQIERRGQSRVIEIGLAGDHGVLIGAEALQTMLHEVAQRVFGLRRGDRVIEAVELSRRVGKDSVHHAHDFLRDVVGAKRPRRLDLRRARFAEAFPVVGVEVPFIA